MTRSRAASNASASAWVVGSVPDFLAALERDEQLRYDAIEWVDADRWHTGRVLLIGDAAHAGARTWARAGAWRWRTPTSLPRSYAPLRPAP